MSEVTYVWGIDYLKTYPMYEDKQNVVCVVAWQLVATDGTYNSLIQGSVSVPTEQLSTFTPYDELTQPQVLGWVKEMLGPEQILMYENAVLTQLQDMINPPVVIPPLPWEPTSVSVIEPTVDPNPVIEIIE